MLEMIIKKIKNTDSYSIIRYSISGIIFKSIILAIIYFIYICIGISVFRGNITGKTLIKLIVGSIPVFLFLYLEIILSSSKEVLTIEKSQLILKKYLFFFCYKTDKIAIENIRKIYYEKSSKGEYFISFFPTDLLKNMKIRAKYNEFEDKIYTFGYKLSEYEFYKILEDIENIIRKIGDNKIKYEYKEIYLEENLKEIIYKLDKNNTEYEDLTFTLLYKPYENIEVYIYLIVGKILLIKIFDESFQIDNTLKVGVKLTDEIINKYDLYYDDFEEVYLSKKYKELVVIVDLADNIIGFSFVRERGEEWDYPKDKIKNYLECKNLLDIYGSLYNNDTLDANIEKKEIYGQLDNYKFTFDIITRDIKSIQNLETGKFIKIKKSDKL